MLTKNCILPKSLEKSSKTIYSTIERCSKALSLAKSFLFGNTAIISESYYPIHSILEINLGFFIIFPGKMHVFIIHPSPQFVEIYHDYYRGIEIDAGNERYFLYQNNEQNVWLPCQKYLIGLYEHYLKHICEKCSLIESFDAAENFSDEQIFLYIFVEKQIDYIDCFDKYIVLYRKNKNNNNAKDLSILENAGVFIALIQCGIKQIRELRDPEQMFCLTKTKHQNSFG